MRKPNHLYAFYDNLSGSDIRADIKYKTIIDLKQILIYKKLTRSKLSEKTGLCENTIKAAIIGNNVTYNIAKKICKVLDYSIDEIFEKSADKVLSTNTITHHHRLISSILTTAVQWQIIFSNPCERVKPPKIEKKEARYLDEKEAIILINELQNESFQYNVAIQLLIFLGLRCGELLGLEWQDVDFYTNCLHIRRSSLYISDKGTFEDTTKTKSSLRVIKIPDNVIELLKQYKHWQDKQRYEMGTKWHESRRLFTTYEGKPLHPDALSKWFREFVREKDLPYVSIHSLRHTNASLMIASGVPIKTVSSRLGHSSVSVTGNIYSHAIMSADEAAAEALQNILTPKENIKVKHIKTNI